MATTGEQTPSAAGNDELLYATHVEESFSDFFLVLKIKMANISRGNIAKEILEKFLLMFILNSRIRYDKSSAFVKRFLDKIFDGLVDEIERVGWMFLLFMVRIGVALSVSMALIGLILWVSGLDKRLGRCLILGAIVFTLLATCIG